MRLPLQLLRRRYREAHAHECPLKDNVISHLWREARKASILSKIHPLEPGYDDAAIAITLHKMKAASHD